MSSTEQSILEKLDVIAPSNLAQFDAFPKVPMSYKARSETRGFLTIGVLLLALVLVLNDIGEYVWGWPEHQFAVDQDRLDFLKINLDVVVNMPCEYLSVDLRDAVGDRLFLSSGFQRDGTFFDLGQAEALKAHSDAQLSAPAVIAASRRSRGLFSVFSRSKSDFRPTYNFKPDGSACRVYGSVAAKKVTANLHVTTLGHGYASHVHVDHSLMNLSHVITEFSFGPRFPDITQPLDNSFQVAEDPFVAYQYFITVVPTIYTAPRTAPLKTNQYSVTHYLRKLESHHGTPGIFFKFDIDPLALAITQRTTSFTQLLIRCVGVIGGIFVCTSYAVKVGNKAVDIVTGGDQDGSIVSAEASGVKKSKWSGGDLRSRGGNRVLRQGSGWVVEGSSPYGSYSGTPMSPGFTNSPFIPPSPFPRSASGYGPSPANVPLPATPGVNSPGGGPGTPGLGPQSGYHSPSPSLGGGFPRSPGPPPALSHQRTLSSSSALRHTSQGSISSVRAKDD